MAPHSLSFYAFDSSADEDGDGTLAFFCIPNMVGAFGMGTSYNIPHTHSRAAA